MALPPTIPTSFVPHAPSGGEQRGRTDFAGALGAVGYGILGIAFALAIGVFIYGRVLAGTQASKDAELAKAQLNVDSATVEGFVRLRDRLASGQTLMNGHDAPSNFFSVLGKVLPASVRVSTMHLSFGNDGTPKLDGSGIAKSFNALAAASTAFAKDGRIKGAIFSKITINKDNSVSFALAATLDPKLVAFALAPLATSTSAVSTTTSMTTASTTPSL